MTMVINAVLFQLGWFACVLGAAHGLAAAGTIVVAAIVGWHLARASQPRREALLLIIACAVGAAFETVLVQSRWVRFDAGVLVDGLAPYFMVALWVLFATTLNGSLRWLRVHPGLGALLGAVGGPAAYYSGARLGAMELTAVGPALVAVAVGWSLLTPLLLYAARRFDGFARS
jgi:hypothetical protein